MAAQAFIGNIKEKYKLLSNCWSDYHREPLYIIVAGRRSNGCSVSHYSRKQMDSDIHVVVKSHGISNLFTAQKGKKRVKRILIEGVPGSDKSTLCQFVIDNWMNGEAFGQFESLNEVLIQMLSEVSVCTSLFHYLKKNDGRGVLIIANGWNELDEKERHSGTLPYELLFGDLLHDRVFVMIVTSRPFATESFGVPQEAVDKFIRVIYGFSGENVEKYEFFDDSEKAYHLLKELASNPTLKCMCTVPINLEIVCHLHSDLDEVGVTTMTELYSKRILNTLALLCGDNQECILTFDAIPLNMQKPWWNLCNLASSTIKNSLFVFSKEVVDRCSYHLLNEDILHFKLLHSVEYGTKNTKYYQFFHVTFQEFLAALYIINKMFTREQSEVCKLYGQSSHFGLVWRFFLGLSLPKSLDVIKNILSTKMSTLDLCHLTFEARDANFSSQLVKKACKSPTFITPTTYDYAIVLHVITPIQKCSDISLDASNCILGETNLNMLADALANECTIKNLVLSGNKLSDNDIINLFSKALRSSQCYSIEKLNLHDNNIGEVGVRFMAKALTKLKSLQLSHNPLGTSGLCALKGAITSGALSDIQEFKLQGSLTEDRNTNDELLENNLKGISDCCDKLRPLDISENCISEKCAKALAMNLSSKWPLQLHVNETTLGNKGFETFCDTCTLEGECGFESLEMKSNHISSEGIQCLVEKVSSGMLLKGEIHLDESPLGMEAVLNIGQLLSNTYFLLSSLSMANCQLNENIGHNTSITANHIYQHLLQMSQNSGLSQLELDCNNFTEDGLQILTGFMHLCPCLKFLSSRYCQLTSVDLNALLTKLSEERVYDKLLTWCLGNCNIDNNGVNDLIKYVPLIFPNLNDIHLDSNSASADVKSKLKEILNDMKTKERDDVLQVETDGSHPHDQLKEMLNDMNTKERGDASRVETDGSQPHDQSTQLRG